MTTEIHPELKAHVDALAIVDSHEHLEEERQRLARPNIDWTVCVSAMQVFEVERKREAHRAFQAKLGAVPA